MPIGLFKTPDQSAQVEYDGVSIPIPRSTYEKNGYKPDLAIRNHRNYRRTERHKLGSVPKCRFP